MNYLIAGIVLIILAVGAFWFSLPRHGKLAPFVGTQLEGFAVAFMVAALGGGLASVIAGVGEIAK